ncbi:oligosaccharide flippase family protein [Candidatus Sumerlaeota bacterium]|nr:oligosaccharide flippase family protein [Candidatus Sumerlaeota bacterium]
MNQNQKGRAPEDDFQKDGQFKRTMKRSFWENLKKSDIFHTLSHAKNYLSAGIAVNAIGFISIPVYSRLFSQSDYGVVSVFNAYIGIITIILSLNAHTSIGRYYYENKDNYKEFLGTSMIVVGVIFSIMSLISLLFKDQISQIINLPPHLLKYMIVISLFFIIYNIYYQILIPRKKSREASILSIIKGYSGFIIAVPIILLMKENRYMGQIWASLLTGLFISIVISRRIHKQITFIFNPEHLKYIVNYSFPLIPYALSGVILSQFDRIMINKIVDTSSAGLYSMGYNVGMLILLLSTALRTATLPDFFKFQDNGEYKRLDDLIKKTFSLILITALGMVFFAREMVLVLSDKKFHEALSIVPIVVTGYIFFEMSNIHSVFFGYEKKTVFVSFVVLFSGVCNIILNAVYIPRYGYVAGAYTTVASYFIMFILNIILVRIFTKSRLIPLRLTVSRFLVFALFVALFAWLKGYSLSFLPFSALKILMIGLFSLIILPGEAKGILKGLKS